MSPNVKRKLDFILMNKKRKINIFKLKKKPLFHSNVVVFEALVTELIVEKKN